MNIYLDVCSMNIVGNGGEVTKYMGDCVMANFTTEHADAAIEACLGALRDVREVNIPRHSRWIFTE